MPKTISPDDAQPSTPSQPQSPMGRWIALEIEARGVCRRLELLPEADPLARRLLGLLYQGRALMAEAQR